MVSRTLGTLVERYTVGDEVPDHESGAIALQYQSDDRRHRYVAHTLLDSGGGNGVWLDGDNQLGRWRQRYGIFWLEPELLWSDASLTDDQQGIYTRSELRSSRYNLTVGTTYYVMLASKQPDSNGPYRLRVTFSDSLPEPAVNNTCGDAIDASLGDIFGPIGLPPMSEVGRITIASLAPMLPFILLVLILMIRPRGLMGAREF